LAIPWAGFVAVAAFSPLALDIVAASRGHAKSRFNVVISLRIDILRDPPV
jgi:hypothetical protein